MSTYIMSEKTRKIVEKAEYDIEQNLKNIMIK